MANLFRLDRSGNLEFVTELLNSGQPVALPTETVYGLAARMDLPAAVAAVFQLKNRPHFDPLIVHVLRINDAQALVKEVSVAATRLMESFWPGPLTILFEKNSKVPDLVTAGSNFVAIRSPKHPAFRQVLESLDHPYLVAPSANRFTSVSPTKVQDVLDELGPYGLAAAVDGGPCEIGVESTVVKLDEKNSVLEVLRPGAISIDQIKNCLDPKIEIKVNPTGSGAAPSPGTHHTHYSPGVPARFFEKEADLQVNLSRVDVENSVLIEVLAGSLKSVRSLPWKKVVSLGKTQAEAAQNVFQVLRQMGTDRVHGFVAVAGAESGLGLAINDRLRRAAGKG